MLKTVIRDSNPKENVSHDRKDVGEIEDRCFCSETQSPTTELLVTDNRSSSNRSGHNEAAVVEEGRVLIPSLEDDTAGATNDSEAETNKSSSSHTIVVEPVLVPYDIKDETSRTANNLEDK
ncbi:hypothetical protein HPULCUR_003539 [Helicostylum pulchrum]|uniref:Uncharacterized protein n=1 Tax=Helicostylum pulchrum TaxID=562976 RepID=A0ABP9XTN9_9FUNG